MLICCPGGIQGAYILRTLGSAEFNYGNAKNHLINLDLDSLRPRTMHFNTVAGDEAEGGAETYDERQARLMQLATWINLDSRFSVSLNIRFISIVSLTAKGGLCRGSPWRCTTPEGCRIPVQSPGCKVRIQSSIP